MATLKGLVWRPGTDIHLLPGDSWALRTRLSTFDDAGTEASVTALPAGFHVDFIGEFAGAPHNNGAKMVVSTGVVSMDSPPPTVPSLFNFLVRAELRVTAGNALVGDPVRLRVHLHSGLTTGARKIWLTPSRLSIHKSADGQAFTVLAAFTDGTVGDITENGGLKWSSSGAAVTVDADSGALAGKTVGQSPNITVTNAGWGGASASAPVDVLDTWDAGAPVATFLAGPGADKFTSVPNILFVSEGFTEGDRTGFTNLLTKIINSLETEQRLAPFDVLSAQVNYWSAFLPAPKPAALPAEAGTSEINELSLLPKKAELFGFPLPPGRMPSAGLPLKQWTMSELTATIGLPVPGEAMPATGTVAAWITQRQTLYGFPNLVPVDDDDRKRLASLARKWGTLADRRMCNERNSALGMAIGQRPNFERSKSPQLATFHPRRTKRAQLDGFLAKLTAPKAAGVGATWNASAATPGKDARLVVALIAGAAYGGAEGALVAISLEARHEVKVSPVSGGPEIDHVPYPVPSRPSVDTLTTIVHETGHALGLDDEYSEPGSLDPTAAVTALNVQDSKSLRGGVLTSPLNGTKLKWLWPRIHKARVLSDKPHPSGTDWELPLAPISRLPTREPFVPGDIIRLRTRSLSPAPKISDTFRIATGGVHPDKLVVTPDPGSTLTPADFPANSLAYTPVPDPQGGDELQLVHKKIKAHISQPLNAPKNPPANRTCDDHRVDETVQQANNWPADIKMPAEKYRPWETIGAYEGGHRVACGVYHPAGGCMMGAQILDKTVPDEKQWVLQFCAVCKYILVDTLDPSLHEKVDHWIGRRYPIPIP